MPDVLTLDEGIEVAERLHATGALDFLDVSGVPTIGSIGTEFGGDHPVGGGDQARPCRRSS